MVCNAFLTSQMWSKMVFLFLWPHQLSKPNGPLSQVKKVPGRFLIQGLNHVMEVLPMSVISGPKGAHVHGATIQQQHSMMLEMSEG